MIESFDFSGEGMQRVYENDKWMIGIKNWKPANDISQFREIERHHKTDELFVLLEGSCDLLTVDIKDGTLEFQNTSMERNRVYCIPRGSWHNTITSVDVKLIVIEDSSTSQENSSMRKLTEQEYRSAVSSIYGG